jgi:probable phosphoglycerate mutase
VRGARLSGLLAAALLALAGAAAAQGQGAPATPPGTSVARVFVVRHAQAWKNVPRASRPPGMSDAALDSLTEQGLAQAERIGRRLADAGARRVATSPARRARQTGEAIARALGADGAAVSDALRPLEPGADPRAADSRWRTANWKAGRDPQPRGGESLADGLARAASYIEAQARSGPDSTLVVVTHGEIAAALVSKAAGVHPLAGYAVNFVDEGTISEIELLPEGRWRLVSKGARP